MSAKNQASTRFVLDASVALRWALSDGSIADLDYADQVLASFMGMHAIVPGLWFTEIAHVLGGATKRGMVSLEHSERSLERFNKLPIEVDDAKPALTQLQILRLMIDFNTSAYDAQYLELAARLKLPLATLDIDLRKAAKKCGVPLYLN